MPEREPIVYQFPPFVFRKDTGRLERNGFAIRLSDQAAKVLGEFVERPGELIPRGQLSRLLWPDGVFTESELGINKIISKLRISLHDDPRKPQYIETIPKRGYRFLAAVAAIPLEPLPPKQEAPLMPVASGSVAPSSPVPATLEPVDLAPAPSVSPVAQPSLPLVRPALATRSRVLWLLAACVLLAVAGIFWRMRPVPPAPVATEVPFTLAVAPFEVKENDVKQSDPGDEQLAESFRLDLIDSLSQMPGIGVRAAHSVTGRSPDALGRAAPQKLDVMAILYTRFMKIGDTYTLQMELVRNSDSAHLDRVAVQGNRGATGVHPRRGAGRYLQLLHRIGKVRRSSGGEHARSGGL